MTQLAQLLGQQIKDAMVEVRGGPPPPPPSSK
jgi:hypothetical protein